MAPIALPEGYSNQPNGAFQTPQLTGNGHLNGNGNGYANTETDSEAGNDHVEVHPTARRSPEGGLIKVEEGKGTRYLEKEGEIRSVFVDRGASVKSE